MRIHGQLTKETYKQIKGGAVSEFPLEHDFIQTQGGPLSSHELLVLFYQEFGEKPFVLTAESTQESPKVNRFAIPFMSDKLRER